MQYFELESSEDTESAYGTYSSRRKYAPASSLRLFGRILSLVSLVVLFSLSFIINLSQTSSTWNQSPLSIEVDLGYAIYRGRVEEHTGMTAWRGIRYAAPPVGNLRWRAPQAPEKDRSQVIDADNLGPYCPQTPVSPTPAGYNYRGSEDCLFLSVYAPSNARNLPVFFYIHGGGYGAGGGEKDVTQITSMNDYGFVSVVIQYRLEAFGFLASSAIHKYGDLNVGLRDQHFALEWVQRHISKFGGDPKRVTLAGQSAGGGSVEMQALAYGGSEGTKYFSQGIASSPYNPVTYEYSDDVPEKTYIKFAREAGCYSKEMAAGVVKTSSIVDCLRSADTEDLQRANFMVGSGTNFGSWAFGPVVDGDFLQQRPSQQLRAGKVNGKRILTSCNADEGAQFVDPSISDQDDFDDWLRIEYPMLVPEKMLLINEVFYPLGNSTTGKHATCGDCDAATAVDVSSFAVGHLQRAMNFYAEATFDCPAYWLASAFSEQQKSAYLYQFSVPPADHGMDISAEGLGGLPDHIGPDLNKALTRAWGNFVRTGDPSITNLLANGESTHSSASHPARKWPKFSSRTPEAWQMLNFNQTGGVASQGRPIAHLPPVAQYTDPGMQNDIRLVNGYKWEGGRGARCEFLASISANIPV